MIHGPHLPCIINIICYQSCTLAIKLRLLVEKWVISGSPTISLGLWILLKDTCLCVGLVQAVVYMRLSTHLDTRRLLWCNVSALEAKLSEQHVCTMDAHLHKGHVSRCVSQHHKRNSRNPWLLDTCLTQLTWNFISCAVLCPLPVHCQKKRPLCTTLCKLSARQNSISTVTLGVPILLILLWFAVSSCYLPG